MSHLAGCSHVWSMMHGGEAQEEEFQVICCPDARKGGDCSGEGLSSCSSRTGEVRPGWRRKGLCHVLNVS